MEKFIYLHPLKFNYMNKYKIKLNGLKDGSYSNSFTIRGEFFEAFNTSEIKYVNIDICLLYTSDAADE